MFYNFLGCTVPSPEDQAKSFLEHYPKEEALTRSKRMVALAAKVNAAGAKSYQAQYWQDALTILERLYKDSPKKGSNHNA